MFFVYFFKLYLEIKSLIKTLNEINVAHSLQKEVWIYKKNASHKNFNLRRNFSTNVNSELDFKFELDVNEKELPLIKEQAIKDFKKV